MRGCTILTTLLAAVTSVAAHGYVTQVTADGAVETGWLPFTDPYMSPPPVRAVRKIPNDGPVTDASNPDIACGQGGETGTTRVMDINAGSDIQFHWTNWLSDHKGPVMTLMASCNGDCSNFNAADGKWFKIDQGGYNNGQWASDKLIAEKSIWTSTIPAGLVSGQYLVRYEIVALHSVGAPQYYPGCVQVNVKNGGADQPAPNELTTLPGMYNGAKWPDIYTDDLSRYVPAGPSVVSFADGGSPGSATTPPSVSSSGPHNSYGSSSTVSRPRPSSTPAVPASTSVCRTKKKTNKRSVPGRYIHRRSFRH